MNGNRHAAKVQFEKLRGEFAKMGLKLNPAKCASLVLLADKKKKITVVDTWPFLMVDGKNVPTMDVKSVYKYLGLKLGFGGYETQDVVDTFQEKIERLGKAQLRPQQKLWGLKTVLNRVCYTR